MSALLMACYFQGLNPAEIAALTQAISPAEAASSFDASLAVADNLHRGRGRQDIPHAGPHRGVPRSHRANDFRSRSGTHGGHLDKLEAIPGFRVQYTMAEFKALVEKHGYALVGQSERLVPADKRIYALRDVTHGGKSRLITASIMSKKIAEGRVTW